MKLSEAAALLTVAASYDSRKPDEDTATAWMYALDGLRFEDCRLAVVEHYQRSTDWMMPKHVIDSVRRIRSKRIAEGEHALIPPADLDPWQTITWLSNAKRRLGDGESPEAVAADRGELRKRSKAEVLELVQRATPTINDEEPA